MNIQTQIEAELWKAVAKSYDSGVYRSAILDAIHHLTDVLRDKANLDGDGFVLVGQALGGDTPLIRINKFQTQSEKNEQKGFADILRGLYTAIRNPRSHEQIEDTQATADAIILFVNYVLSVINQSRGPFILEDWIDRVFDSDFVDSSKYADLLVSEVPAKKHIDALITLYREKSRDKGNSLQLVSDALIKVISTDRIEDFLTAVSDDLKVQTNESSIIITLRMIPSNLWPQLSKIAVMRIENKLIRSILSGVIGEIEELDYDDSVITRPYVSGIFGTWSVKFIDQFTLKDELCDTLFRKIQIDTENIAYVTRYFLRHLPKIIENSNWGYESTRDAFAISICEDFSNFDSRIKQDFVTAFHSLPDDWKSELLRNLEHLKQSDAWYYKKLDPSFTPIIAHDTLPDDEDLPF